MRAGFNRLLKRGASEIRAMPSLANTAWVFVILIPLSIAMHVGVILREEDYLERKFGEPYRRYRESVRRYL
jgi:protein-S-isoprenylcysteine O-methyltransferase Ste14